MNQPNIFEMIHDRYTLPKKVKLFEAFAGIGCQRMAFEKENIEYEVVGISEIDKFALDTYRAMHGECPNFGSIKDIHQLPEIDVFTWSFPCTDLSKAGAQRGLQGGTRSGLVYEVLRILHETNNKPRVLIMENVVDLVQTKFIRQFNAIQHELETLGYTNYVSTMNAKDYGVAQNRDRAFMVSILGGGYYEFPKPVELKKRLKDYLETDVDEKYFLSEAMFNYCTDMTDRNGFVRGLRFHPHDKDAEYAFAITTHPGSRPVDNFIKEPHNAKETLCNKLVASGKYQEGDIIRHSYTNNRMQIEESRTENKDHPGVSSCLTTRPDTLGIFVEEKGLRIRKLTPRECWRLMGIGDDYYDRASKKTSNAQLYKQAGNGIVIDVMAAILSTMKEK